MASITGMHLSPRQSPVVQPVAFATSATVFAPASIASFTRGYRIVLQMQTGRNFRSASARFCSDVSGGLEVNGVANRRPVLHAVEVDDAVEVIALVEDDPCVEAFRL